jgi:hypothetical protein
MGGTFASGAIQDADVSGQPLDANGQPTSPQFRWKTIGMSVRSEVTSQGGTSISTAQSGNGCIEDSSGLASAMDPRLANSMFPSHLPWLMLQILLKATDRPLVVISDTGSQTMVHLQSVKLASDQTPISETRQDWYVDMTTGLPTRVDYVIPSSSGSDGTGTDQFTSWQKRATVLIPQLIQITQNGNSLSTVSLGAPSFNQGLAPSMFQLA